MASARDNRFFIRSVALRPLSPQLVRVPWTLAILMVFHSGGAWANPIVADVRADRQHEASNDDVEHNIPSAAAPRTSVSVALRGHWVSVTCPTRSRQAGDGYREFPPRSPLDRPADAERGWLQTCLRPLDFMIKRSGPMRRASSNFFTFRAAFFTQPDAST
jgi:hypothetical protein